MSLWMASMRARSSSRLRCRAMVFRAWLVDQCMGDAVADAFPVVHLVAGRAVPCVLCPEVVEDCEALLDGGPAESCHRSDAWQVAASGDGCLDVSESGHRRSRSRVAHRTFVRLRSCGRGVGLGCLPMFRRLVCLSLRLSLLRCVRRCLPLRLAVAWR